MKKKAPVVIGIITVILTTVGIVISYYWSAFDYKNDIKITNINVGEAQLLFPESIVEEIQPIGIKWFLKHTAHGYVGESIIAYKVSITLINDGNKACIIDGYNISIEPKTSVLYPNYYLYADFSELPIIVSEDSVEKIEFYVYVNYQDILADTANDETIEEIVINNRFRLREHLYALFDNYSEGYLDGSITRMWEDGIITTMEWSEHPYICDYDEKEITCYTNEYINRNFNESISQVNGMNRNEESLSFIIDFITVDNNVYSGDITPQFINKFTYY